MASELVSICGLYCGACSFRIAAMENDKNHIDSMPSVYDHVKNLPLEFCPGCRLENKCGECAIRDCAMERKVDYCSKCGDFPCNRISAFSKDGKPHHEEILQNFALLESLGETRWLEYMAEKWKCKKCEVKRSWYYKKCGHD